MNKYREPILLNCIALLVLGFLLFLAWVIPNEHGHAGSLKWFGAFLVATWGLPFLNALRFMESLGTKPKRVLLVYALLTLFSFAAAWMTWAWGVRAFSKIGG